MAFTFKVKKRCRFCGTVLREDGTCPNQKCPRYVPDKPETTDTTTDNGGK
jgi:phage FluMu protein Com